MCCWSNKMVLKKAFNGCLCGENPNVFAFRNAEMTMKRCLTKVA
jgi:hypothetical protein